MIAAVLAAPLLLAGCATGHDAVVQGSQYEFVSPGGQTKIFYAPDQRKPLPDLSGESVTEPGRQIHLSDFAGDVVVLNIWGSWCGPCRAEAPELQQVYNQTQPLGVRLVGIDERDERAAAADFIHDNQLTYPSIFDPSGRALLPLAGYPRNTVPSTIVLDRQHRVAAVYLQALHAGDLLPELTSLAASKP